MDIIAAYRDVGSYRGAAAICGVDHKTVKATVDRLGAEAAGEAPPARAERARNFDIVAEVVAARVKSTAGRISAKRLLPEAITAGYTGSARNFRRLVAKAKRSWHTDNHRGRRPGMWAPGEHLLIDWGVQDGLHVFCAVLGWSRWRFARFATDERADTTLAMLTECFEAAGGVPKVVLADRMGCLKGGVVANVVIPTPAYVRFATHYRFRPDFCEAADPASKGMVERLVGYAKSDLMVPKALDATADIDAANVAAKAWCAEVNGRTHSEICAIPDCRLLSEVALLGALPSLRPVLGHPTMRKVDRLSCVRIGGARYSVPNRLIGVSVQVLAADGHIKVVDGQGEVVATHDLVGPGEASVKDDHYGGPRPAPARKPRPRADAERIICELGKVGESFIKAAAAAGVTKLGAELEELCGLLAAHDKDVFVVGLTRATAFGRFRAADVRSILAAGAGAPKPTEPGEALVIALPGAPSRALSDYAPEAFK